jgi:hypothetical protein
MASPPMRVIIRTDGSVEDLPPTAIGNFDKMKAAAGIEFAEVVEVSENYIMLIDEEGKLTGKSYNATATDLFHLYGGSIHDFIVGNAVVIPRRDLK